MKPYQALWTIIVVGILALVVAALSSCTNYDFTCIDEPGVQCYSPYADWNGGDEPAAPEGEPEDAGRGNRSGGGDDTNPGDHGNEDGHDNPGRGDEERN